MSTAMQLTAIDPSVDVQAGAVLVTVGYLRCGRVRINEQSAEDRAQRRAAAEQAATAERVGAVFCGGQNGDDPHFIRPKRG